MDETKLALILRVVTSGAMGVRDYGLLLTDRRSIFVSETDGKVLSGAVLGGAVGAAIAQAATARTSVDYDRASPEDLARRSKSVVVPHASIVRIALRRKLGAHRLRIEYDRGDGKTKKFEAIVLPPDAHVKSNKVRGMKPKAILAAYAENVKQAYQRALPPVAAAKAEWGS
jgi:hypothetical protein